MVASSEPKGRPIGLVYLLYFLAAIGAAVLVKSAVGAGDAASVAKSILAHEPSYQLGVSLGIVADALYVALVALFYDLFRTAAARPALLAAAFGLCGCGLQLCGALFQIVPLVILKDVRFAAAFAQGGADVAALLSLKLYSEVYVVSLVLFGLFDFLIGWLILKSGYAPRILGVLMLAAGAAWLVFLWPPLAGPLSKLILPLGGGAEALLMVWLLAMGVRARGREV